MNTNKRVIELSANAYKGIGFTDLVKLADNTGKNLADLLQDTRAREGLFRSKLEKEFPITAWLLSTNASQVINNTMVASDSLYYTRKENGHYVIDVPTVSLWDYPITIGADECCFTLPKFDKCQGKAEIREICVKDCKTLIDLKMESHLKANISTDYGVEGTTVADVYKELAKQTMAWKTNEHILKGSIKARSNTLVEFAGLLDVMANPAVVKIQGVDVIEALKQLLCRVTALKGSLDGYVFLTHPLIESAIASQIKKDQYGNYPDGFNKEVVDGKEAVTFYGCRFITDRAFPIDLTAKTGNIICASGNDIGLYLDDTLMVSDRSIVESGTLEKPLAEGCFASCTAYTNFGGVFTTNASGVAVIADVPMDLNCVQATSDLKKIVTAESMTANLG